MDIILKMLEELWVTTGVMYTDKDIIDFIDIVRANKKTRVNIT